MMVEPAIGIVIGATGGIGGACLARLAPSVVQTLAVSRRPAPQRHAEANVMVLAADVSLESGRERICSLTREIGLPIRFLVIASGTAHRGPLEDATAEAWEGVFRNNVVGPALLLSELTHMPWAQPASVVVIGSLSARRALPHRAIYGASKAAIEHFAVCAAIELAPRRIAVNVVSTGVVDTPFIAGDRLRLEDYVGRRVPSGRFASPTEIADVVAYLVSAPEFLTGSTIAVDGGAGVMG